MARSIRWLVPSLTLLVVSAVGCGGGKTTDNPPPAPEPSSEAKVISHGSPSIGETRKPGQKAEEGRVAPTMPRAERADFHLSSSTIQHHGAIPAKHTCDAEGVSPALEWRNPPENVKSYTLLVDDPDSSTGKYDQWIVYNLPPDTLSLPEGQSADPVLKSAGGAKQGKNGAGKIGWAPLCAEKGPAHRVVFRLYALDIMLDVPAGATRAQVESAYKGHFLGQCAIIASYARK